MLFAAFAFIVLLGTVFPLLVEAVNGKRVSVGVPYFNRMTMPIGLTLLFLMAVAPVLPWRKASSELLRHRLLWPAWIGHRLRGRSACCWARPGLAPLLAFGLGGFAAGSAGRQLVLATRRQGWRGLVGRANGGMIVHLGVVVIAVAFAASASNVRQAEFSNLVPGDTATIAGHTITYVRENEVVDSNKTSTQALVIVDGHGPYSPGISKFTLNGSTVGTPSVFSRPTVDVALSLLVVPETPDGPITPAGDGAADDHVAVDRRCDHGRRHRAGRLPGSSPSGHRAGVGSRARARPVAARFGRPRPPERSRRT